LIKLDYFVCATDLREAVCCGRVIGDTVRVVLFCKLYIAAVHTNKTIKINLMLVPMPSIAAYLEISSLDLFRARGAGNAQ